MFGIHKFGRGHMKHPGYNGGGKAQKSVSTTENYSPAEAARRTKVMDRALAVYDTTAPELAAKGYTGPKPVEFSQESLAAQNLATQNAYTAQQSNGKLNQGLDYGLTTAMDVENNPYLQRSVEAAIRPITQSYTDTGGVMSQIRDGSQDAGQFGSSRQGVAEGIAAGRYANEIGDVSGKMYSTAYDKGQDTFARTLALGPQTIQSGATPASWLSSVGAQKETLGQEKEQYASDASMWSYNSQWAPLNNLASLIYGGGSSQGTTTSSTPKAPSNRVGGALGGAAAGASIGSVIPGIGTAIGAVAGGIIGAIAS